MQDRQEQLAQIYHDLRVYLKQQGMEEPIVCGDGAVQAWMFMLGEAPGAEEVREGRPFVGKAGKNLDAFLLQTGIEREQIFISNVVKFRPYRIGPIGRKRHGVSRFWSGSWRFCSQSWSSRWEIPPCRQCWGIRRSSVLTMAVARRMQRAEIFFRFIIRPVLFIIKN